MYCLGLPWRPLRGAGAAAAQGDNRTSQTVAACWEALSQGQFVLSDRCEPGNGESTLAGRRPVGEGAVFGYAHGW